MPGGRPLKRPSDAVDSPADALGASVATNTKVKLPRLERGPEDFSSVVKSKLQSYTRTGQACDRCKVRKIRCDALPEGCSHCINQNLECYVTDRVTGRTERRGYLQQLEREKAGMMAHVRELEELLETNGVHVRPWPGSGDGQSVSPRGQPPDATARPMNQCQPPKDDWTQVGSPWTKQSQQHQDAPSVPSLEQDWQAADKYIGVASDNAPLSSIKGTQLSILGTTIDITSFDAPDMDGPPPGTPKTTPLYNKSVQAFYNSVFKVNPPLDVPLPPREDAFNYSEWYMVCTWPFLPFLHKPSYFKLLTSIYDEPSFKAPVADLVIVHMVMATMFHQFASRNADNPDKRAQLNDLSNRHYHWCLDKIYDLSAGTSLSSIQALAMICCHSRSFPKPGCGYLTATLAFTRALDMNLHRPFLKKGSATNLENEMRKRVWWCVLMTCVILNGRLGRPMPIRTQDFDVDLPVCIPDEALDETGITDETRIGEYTWPVAYHSFKVVCLFMDMWSHLYCVRRDPQRYMETFQRLDQRFRKWREEIPDEFKVGNCKPTMQVAALYIEAVSCELDLCLRHPSVISVSKDPIFYAENSRLCEDAARNLLRVGRGIAKLKSLDTTWYQMSVYLTAIFTLLVAHWERRHDTTYAEISKLRGDMDMGVEIVTEVAKAIGAGGRLTNEINAIIDRTIAWIEQDMGHINGSAAAASRLAQPGGHIKQEAFSPTVPTQSHQQPVSTMNTPTTNANGSSHQTQVPSTANIEAGSYYSSSMPSAGTNYSQLGYAGMGQAAVPTQNNGTGSVPTTYSSSNDQQQQYMYAASAAIGMANNSGNGSGPSTAGANPLVAFASQATQQQQQHGHLPNQNGGGSSTGADWTATAGSMNTGPSNNTSWKDWTNAIMDPASQDRYSANALLTLGGVHRDNGESRDMGVGTEGDVPVPPGQTSQWPMLIFHDGNVP